MFSSHTGRRSRPSRQQKESFDSHGFEELKTIKTVVESQNTFGDGF